MMLHFLKIHLQTQKQEGLNLVHIQIKGYGAKNHNRVVKKDKDFLLLML